MPGRRLRAVLTAAGIALLGAIALAPWAAHRGHWWAALVYAFFDPVCHQLPERSFQLWGEPLAVCHRCAGLYLGGAIGLLLWPPAPRAASALLARPRWALALAAPLLIDVLALPSTMASRFLTGLLAALPMALFVLAAAAQIGTADRARGAPARPATATGGGTT